MFHFVKEDFIEKGSITLKLRESVSMYVLEGRGTNVTYKSLTTVKITGSTHISTVAAW